MIFKIARTSRQLAAASVALGALVTSPEVHAQRLYGGEGISSSGTVRGHACSAGFNLKRVAVDGDFGVEPKNFMVTAGHCAKKLELGDPWWEVDLGWNDESNLIGYTYWTALTESFGGVVLDMALVELPDKVPHGAQGAVTYDTDYERSNAENSPLGLGGLRLVITGIVEEEDMYVGQEVCVTGATSGSSCGQILNVRPHESYFTDACIAGGDSGGAMYIVDRDRKGELIGTARAAGVVRGGQAHLCGDSQGGATFTPLSRLRLGTGDEFEPLHTHRVQFTKRNATGFAIDGNNGAGNRQSIYLWPESQENVNQLWFEINRGDGYYSYQKADSTHCIDGGAGGELRQDVYLWECSAGNFNQHWKKISVGDGAFKLVKRNAPDFAINGGNGGKKRQNVNLHSSSSNSQNLHWYITPVE